MSATCLSWSKSPSDVLRVESNGPCGLPQTIGGTWQYKMQKIMIDQSVWGGAHHIFLRSYLGRGQKNCTSAPEREPLWLLDMEVWPLQLHNQGEHSSGDDNNELDYT